MDAEGGTPASSSRHPAHFAFHQSQHLARPGVPAQPPFGEQQVAVETHLEHTTRGLLELYLHLRKGLVQLGRQTGGPRLIVSNDAVFDRDAHRAETFPFPRWMN
jgi:hypothetical protein